MGVWEAINTSTEAISGGAEKARDLSTGAAVKGRDASWSAASMTVEAVKTISSSTGAIASGAAVKGRDASWSAASMTVEAVKTISSSTGAVASGAAVKGWDAVKMIGSSTGAIATGAAVKGWNAASWMIHAVKERAPDREGWEKIGRVGRRVADHALAEVTRPYTAGIPVYRYIKEEYFGNSNLKNQPVKDGNKNLELREALKRLDGLEKAFKEEIKQKDSDRAAQISNQKFPEFVNWKPIEWNFEME